MKSSPARRSAKRPHLKSLPWCKWSEKHIETCSSGINSFNNHPNAHLLQTGEWGELKSAFGWEAIRVVNGNLGAQILIRKLSLGLTIAYIPKLAIADRQLAISEEFWNEVDVICKKHGAIFLKIELDVWDDEKINHPSSFILSKQNIQPPRTIIVDIRGSEEDILARMKQKCRYNIRLAEKKGVTVRTWDDIDGFYIMIQITGGRDSFGVHSLEYYRRAYDLFHPTGTCELLVAEFENKPLAALMVFARGKRAWYIYGASNDEERNRMPTYLLQWEAMRWARAKARKNMIYGACLTKMKQHSKGSLKNAMMVCGASIVSNAASAANSSALRKL